MKLRVYFQNVRGLRTKINDFCLNVLSSNYDIICLNETFLNSTIYDGELFSDEYVVYRKDRDLSLFPNKTDGGGCLIAVNKKFNSFRITEWEVFVEELWVGLTSANSEEKLYLNVPYISNCRAEDYEHYFDNISCIMNEHPRSKFVLLGDYNLPMINWSVLEDGSLQAAFIDNRVAQYLLQMLNFTGSSQFNCIKNFNIRILDLVISNIEPCFIEVARSQDVLSRIDLHHPPLDVTLTIGNLKLLKPSIKQFRIFRKGNYDRINSLISNIDWVSLFNNLNVNDSVKLFYFQINKIISEIIPISNCKLSRFPVWYSMDLIKLIGFKFTIRKKFKKYNDPDYGNLFKVLRRFVKREIARCYALYIESVESSIQKNPKKFWSFTKAIKKSGLLPQIMRNNLTSASSSGEMANMFGDYFESVYSNVPSSDSSSFSANADILVDLPDLVISQDDILAQINQLCLSKGCGSDGIPPLFWFSTACSICLPLFLIFNRSIEEGIFPDRFKSTMIIPIYKSGDKSLVFNYRAIAIINVISKVFEKIIYQKVVELTSHLISAKQHGFVRNRSTLTNLLNFTEFVYNALDSSLSVDVIYTDFTKAFDKVNHRILLSKLFKLGFSGSVVSWFGSYLSNRSNYVEINGSKSNCFSPSSGVPQGSILGPLLFLFFINDVSLNIDSEIILFADDLKLFRAIGSPSDCVSLQNDLDRIAKWCDVNGMELNIGKCCVLKIKSRAVSVYYVYKIGNHNLGTVSHLKDLGITIDDKFSFNVHIYNIINNSYKILGFIMRSGSNFKSMLSFTRIYNGLVRANLEYLTTIWNPQYKIHQNNVERVQKKFTRSLYYKFKIPYEDYSSRLLRLNLVSLATRRIICDESVLFKIINHLIDTTLVDKIQFRRNDVYSLRSSSTFNLSTYRTNRRTNSPLIRLQKFHNIYFNSYDFVSFRSLSAFMKVIKKSFVNVES